MSSSARARATARSSALPCIRWDVPTAPSAETITTLESLLRPRGALPRAVQRLTGLTPEDVADAPAVEDVAKPIATALAGRTIVWR